MVSEDDPRGRPSLNTYSLLVPTSTETFTISSVNRLSRDVRQFQSDGIER
jgi:hypothetical protein